MHGFTMVELIMVIVLLGILIAVVGPRFFERQVFDERLYYEESLSAVRYGQKLALASGCQIHARVDGTGYALSYAAACGGVASGSPVANPSGGDYTAGNPQNVSVSPALNVTFDSLGTASGAANSASFAGGAFTLRVNLATGFIETTP